MIVYLSINIQCTWDLEFVFITIFLPLTLLPPYLFQRVDPNGWVFCIMEFSGFIGRAFIGCILIYFIKKSITIYLLTLGCPKFVFTPNQVHNWKESFFFVRGNFNVLWIHLPLAHFYRFQGIFILFFKIWRMNLWFLFLSSTKDTNLLTLKLRSANSLN